MSFGYQLLPADVPLEIGKVYEGNNILFYKEPLHCAVFWMYGDKDYKLYQVEAEVVRRAGLKFEAKQIKALKEFSPKEAADMLTGIVVNPENGSKKWFVNALRHRDSDLPAVEWTDGSKFWYCKGQLHRADGPAIEWKDGTREWYSNGLLHRHQEPAVIYPDGQCVWYNFGTIVGSEWINPF